MLTSLRAHAAVVVVAVPLALGAPLQALADSPSSEREQPSVVADATVRSAPLRVDEEEADRLEPAAAAVAHVGHVQARLTKYDEATVTWTVSATGQAPSGFVVELVPYGDGPIVSVSAGAAKRSAVVSRVASATRFTARVTPLDARGVAQQPITGNSVLTKSMVAAAIATAGTAAKATAAADRARRAAVRADERVKRAGNHWGPYVAAAARAHKHADRLREIAAAANSEATRARGRIVHIS